MLNFHTSLVAYTLTLALAAYAVAFHHFSAGWLALISFVFVGLISHGSSRINSSFFIKTICHGSDDAPKLALTFDDGPTELTPGILDVLRRHNVKATFFCIGNRVTEHPNIVRRASDEGHTIGNHTFSHSPFLDFFSTAHFHRELQKTSQAIQQACGYQPALFRPPYGVTTPGLAYAVQQNNCTCVGWSMRSMDTITTDATLLLSRTVKAIQPGTIFLFHDSTATTAHMLEAFIVEAKSLGYEFQTIDALLSIKAYA